ncbi:Hypothetical Protein OBI_RACECAR_52 [Arthrobacter phage Racecar]|nr:hypothetical protein PBI_RACECAR_134 [Arthrobacter phage Racecar]QFG12808.1 hypothetical protein PBI_MIMI_131 [Arthrobacter phage Mimi]
MENETSETIKKIQSNIEEMEYQWNTESRVQGNRLEWMFNSYKASLNLLDKATRYIDALEKGQTARDLELMLKNEEIHQLQQEIERLKGE